MTIPKDIDKIVIQVPRWAVEKKNFDFMLDTLYDLIEDEDSIKRFKNSLTIGFDGYDKDSRDLWEIKEVREYIRGITLKFPHWFYFCSIEDHSLWLILLAQCRLTKIGPGNFKYNSKDASGVKEFLFQSLNDLFKTHNLETEELEIIPKQIENYYSAGKIPTI
jgi:hypothetical protein